MVRLGTFDEIPEAELALIMEAWEAADGLWTAAELLEFVRSGLFSAASVHYGDGQLGLLVWRVVHDVLFIQHLHAPGLGLQATLDVPYRLLRAARATRLRAYSRRRGLRRLVERDPRARVTEHFEMEAVT